MRYSFDFCFLLKLYSSLFMTFIRHRPMKTITNFLSNLDQLFAKMTKVPYIFPFLVFGTLFVLPVPLKYLFNTPIIYTNNLFAAEAFSTPIINNLLLAVHIAVAIPSILIGPFLFIVPLRKAYPKLHIRFGQIYVIGCILSALTVVPLAIANNPGTPAAYGFTPMATIWFLTTYFAYTSAINKDYVAHRRWIMRSYAMTFAFVHVNMTWKLILPFEYMSHDAIKIMQSMVSWMINLFLVEIYLAGTAFTGRFLGVSKWIHNLTHLSRDDRIYLNFKRPPSRVK